MQFTELNLSSLDFKNIGSFLLYIDQKFASSKFCSHTNRPGGGWEKYHPTGKFLKPTFLAQLWGADFENLLFKEAFSLDFNLKPRFRQMVIDFIPELIAGP